MALLQWALGMTSLAVWKHAAFLTETHCHQQPFPGNYISPFIFSSPFRTPRMLGQRSAVAIMGISTIRVCFVLSMSQCYAPPPAFLPLSCAGDAQEPSPSCLTGSPPEAVLLPHGIMAFTRNPPGPQPHSTCTPAGAWFLSLKQLRFFPAKYVSEKKKGSNIQLYLFFLMSEQL